jgi:CHAT domain-containing protein/tetratricopeptide (TPR) repeat protein
MHECIVDELKISVKVRLTLAGGLMQPRPPRRPNHIIKFSVPAAPPIHANKNPAMSRPRICGIIAAAALAGAMPARSADTPKAAVCEPSPGNVLREIRLKLHDRQRSEATLDLPANKALMLVGRESRIDAILEVRVAGAVQAADNPMRRLGPQRILLEPMAAPQRVTVAGIGKEPARGDLDVMLVSMQELPAECGSALRAMAAGDAQYARAQSISLGDIDAGDTGLRDANAAALDSYRRAVAALPLHGDLRTHALMSVTGALMSIQDWNAALEAAREAETESRTYGTEYNTLRAKYVWAMALMEVAAGAHETAAANSPASQRVSVLLEQARAAFREVAEAHARRGEIYEQALAMNNTGLAYYYEDAFQKAIPEYRVAASLQHGLGERRGEAQAIQNIGLVQLELAQFGAARETFAAALALIDEGTSPKLYADTLNNLSLVDSRTGRYDDALERFDQALALLERVHSDREQARSLQGISNVYRSIGDRRTALVYSERALAKRSEKADFTGYLYSLIAVADGLSDSGLYAEAIAKRTQTLGRMTTGVPRARLLVGQARDQITVGALKDAGTSLAEIIDNKAFGDRVVLGRAWLARAMLAQARHELPAARADLTLALATFREYQLTADEFKTLLISAAVACDARNVEAAARDVDAALALAERLRRASNNPALRVSLWEPVHPAFDLRIRLLLAPESCSAKPSAASSERTRRALEIAEGSRARALDEFRELAARKLDAKPNSPIEKRRQQLFEQIADRRQRIEAAADRGRQDNARTATLRDELVGLMRELDILDAAASPLANKQPDPGAAIRQTLEMIPADTAVVEYWLGESRTYAWLLSRGRIRVFDLGATRRIQQATQRLSESMADFIQVPVETRIANARELHALVVAPLMQDLEGMRTLYFVPDGALHQVAFATLVSNPAPQPPRYLVDDHEIGIGASVASVLAAADRPSFGADAPMLIVADPVYGRDDERFAVRERRDPVRPAPSVAQKMRGASTEGLPRLSGSALEADVIAALFGAGNAERLTGFAATRDALLTRDLARYRVIHFATHSMADIEAPQLSTVVLSTFDAAGKPIAGEVFAGDLLGRRLNADLVVLSGCDSSLGKQFSGEGLLGMRYAAHAAGAHTVVASLWQVSDAVGPQLMAGFYSRMIRANQAPVAALSQAMREAKERRSDPALWGVFQVSNARRAPTVH